MNSTKATARFAGLLYVLFSILAIFAYMYVPATFVVSGDAAATARRISEGEPLYRIGILAALAGQILFIFLVLTLYRLFRDVDRTQARLMAVLVCAGATAEIVRLFYRMAPLVLLSGADSLSVFSRAQLEGLALGFVRMGNQAGQLVTAFWGLWLFPFGILTIKSGFFPKFLGILLFVSGFAYVVTCFASVTLPAHAAVVSRFMMPLYFGELAMVLWLPIMGARVPQVGPEPARAS